MGGLTWWWMEGDQWCSSLDEIPTLRSGQSSSHDDAGDANADAEAEADADACDADADADADAEWSLAAIPSHR